MDMQTNPATSMAAPFAERYDNFIGGKWVAPKDGRYFDNISSVTGKPVGKIARSQAADVEAALDAAHAAKQSWGRTSAGERAQILNRIADRMEENLEKLAIAETWDNGTYGVLHKNETCALSWRERQGGHGTKKIACPLLDSFPRAAVC